ncbi:MAG TPA: histidine phosphatase family protein [Candidatus Saccharimonadales bacterium]|nr:histidine phosphatase family protein [Candidatus Saccharimonadales bacterium]
MKLYFVRHGETDENVNMAGSPADDVSLNQLGIQQAKNLAVELKDVKFDTIISSPLNRTQQTAELVNEYHQLPIQLDTAWRERDLESYLALDVWNDAFDFDKNVQLGNSEPLAEFFGRVYAALDSLKQDHEDKTVLVVSHGGVQSCLYAYANKLPLEGNMRMNPMKNCEYRIYDL